MQVVKIERVLKWISLVFFNLHTFFMHTKARSILIYFTLVVISLSVFFWGLIQAKVFLAPITVAALLAMVILPVCRWFEAKGISRGWASLWSDLLILLFFIVLGGVVTLQVKSISADWSQIKQKIEPKIEELQEAIKDRTGIPIQQQNEYIPDQIPIGTQGSGGQAESASSGQRQQQQEENQSQQTGQEQQNRGQQQQDQDGAQGEPSGSGSSGGSALSSAGSFLGQLFGFLGNFLLMFVYIFFFLLYRHKFKQFLLKLIPEEKRASGKDVINKSTDLAQNYLFGRLLLILFLAILYSIGLTVSGVQHAILISLLAALFSLIPFIGNIIGYILAVGIALFSGSGLMGVLGVSITFAITQFVESYILEPYIVGDKVNLNPIFTIIVVVLGEVVWGTIGMLIAIPALGIMKVLFDHIPVLQPFSYLFGQEEDSEDEQDDDEKGNIFKRTKRWALNKFHAS